MNKALNQRVHEPLVVGTRFLKITREPTLGSSLGLIKGVSLAEIWGSVFSSCKKQTPE